MIFGRSLDGTDDAEMVAIGAPGTWFSSNSLPTGIVRVYTKGGSEGGWSLRGDSGRSAIEYRWIWTRSRFIKEDGSILVIGAPFHNTLTGFSYPVSEE